METNNIKHLIGALLGLLFIIYLIWTFFNSIKINREYPTSDFPVSDEKPAECQDTEQAGRGCW